MGEQQKTNPWKGLQSYQETDIIFGRDDEIKNLYTRILYDTQTVVYGKSGIGKSSIINAGIIPRAKLDGMLPVNIRLAHTTKKGDTPSKPYIEQIKQRISEELDKIGGELEDIKKTQGFEVVQSDGPKSLWELLHRYRMWSVDGAVRKRLIPLLLFDQFEEIFTLEVDNKRIDAFFSELADLLNEVKPAYLFHSGTTDHQTQAPEPLIKKSEDERTNKSRNVFCEIANRKRIAAPEFLEKSEFHLVITLREDFLSDLERHTTYIPMMKMNRFAILPLNEEQAAKIIMNPIEGLISKPVAKEIIQRVTGNADFQLDGVPKIEVNASLLSLYMEQLYNRKMASDKTISSKTIVQYGDDIIKNFYEESIRGIPNSVIETLEEELITNADKRDNIARVDLIAKGVDEEYIDKLLEKKVLQQFCYNNDMRVELIHDILCPVVNNRILNREQIKKEQEIEQRERQQEQKLKHSRRIAIIVSVLAALALIALAYSVYRYITKPTIITKDKYVDVMFVFTPDNTLVGDPWEARAVFDILADSTYKASVINKKCINSDSIIIKGPMADTVIVRMLMDKMNSPFTVQVVSKTEWLCETNDYPVILKTPKIDELQTVTYIIGLVRDKKATYTLNGWVCSVSGSSIYDAFVVFNDKLARTNQHGEFAMTFKDSTELKGSTLYVMKSEYETTEKKGEDIVAALRKTHDETYTIQLKLRDKYAGLYDEELQHIKSIRNHMEDKNTFTLQDSDFFMKYFGQGNYVVKKAEISVSDTTILFFFKSTGDGRTFGLYKCKDKKDSIQKPFNGYLSEIKPPINGHRRWKMSLTAHDSIYNKEIITGTLVDKTVFFDKER